MNFFLSLGYLQDMKLFYMSFRLLLTQKHDLYKFLLE